jgi:nicotinate-nucleotide adenylyltransferase
VRLGLLGGTFDPIHVGHLWMAEHARDSLDLDSVLLIPAARPPHKPDRPLSPYAVRLAMTELGVGAAPGLSTSRLEENAEEPSFTIDTIRRVLAEDPVADLWLVIGGDSLRDLPTWRAPGEILSRVRLAVLPRPGDGEMPPVPTGARVDWLDGPRLHVSSTALRERVRRGGSIRFLVPDPVRDSIETNGLYRDPPRTPAAGERG